MTPYAPLLTSVAMLSVSAGAAHASAGTVDLTWTAPEVCPSSAIVQQRVESILNRPMTLPGDLALSIRARVTQESESKPWRVVLEVDNGQNRSSRVLAAASCDELASATALFVAVLLEPAIEQSGSDGTTEPLRDDVNAAPAAERQPPREQPAPRTEPSAESLWSLGAHVTGVSGLLPEWSLGFGARGDWSWKLLRSSVGATYYLPRRRELEENPAQGARFELYAAHAKLCLQLQGRALTPALCSGAELAVLRGTGFGPGVQAQAQTAVFASLSAGGALFFRYYSPLTLLVSVDAVVPLGSRQFVFAGSDPALLHRPATGVRATCGAQWAL